MSKFLLCKYKERLLRPLAGPRNDGTQKGGPSPNVIVRSPFSPLSLRGAKRRGNLWCPGAVRMENEGAQKRDCHASLRRLAMTGVWFVIARSPYFGPRSNLWCPRWLRERKREIASGLQDKPLAMTGNGSGARNDKTWGPQIATPPYGGSQ